MKTRNFFVRKSRGLSHGRLDFLIEEEAHDLDVN